MRCGRGSFRRAKAEGNPVPRRVAVAFVTFDSVSDPRLLHFLDEYCVIGFNVDIRLVAKRKRHLRKLLRKVMGPLAIDDHPPSIANMKIVLTENKSARLGGLFDEGLVIQSCL